MRVPVQYGGGLRTPDAVREALAAGAERVIVGTAALRDVDFLDEIVAAHGSRVVVSVDVRGGHIATSGWTHVTDLPALEAFTRLHDRGVDTFVYTDADRDGALAGPDLDAVRAVAGAVRGRFLYAGGIGELTHLRALRGLRQVNLAGVVVGKALVRGPVHGRGGPGGAGRPALRGIPAGYQGTVRRSRGRESVRTGRMAVVVAFVAWLAPVAAARRSTPHPDGPGAQRFVHAVSVPKIVEHQTALQRIASLNGDTREVFSPGYPASLDYVVKTLRDAGYNPKVTPFDYPDLDRDPAAGAQPGLADAQDLPARHGGRQRSADGRTSSRWPTRRRSSLPNAPVFPVGEIVDPPIGGSRQRLQGRGLRRRVRQGRARPARDLLLRREVAVRAGRGRHRRDHLQRGQHARAPEPDLHRQPADAEGDDRRP